MKKRNSRRTSLSGKLRAVRGGSKRTRTLRGKKLKQSLKGGSLRGRKRRKRGRVKQGVLFNRSYGTAYEEGFNQGFAKGYEDGHQLAYAAKA